MPMAALKMWLGERPKTDNFGDAVVKEFIDGRTKYGPWAIMTVKSWRVHGVGKLGTGNGQKYRKTGENWYKVEG
jgi:hypothetical protein